MSTPDILVDISGNFAFTTEEIWPDGDAPENITAADVKTVMESCGSMLRVLDDWQFLYGVTVSVTVGDQTLEVWR